MLQHRRITELAAKNLMLRDQFEDVASAQAGHRQVIAGMAGAAEQAESQLNELMRRGAGTSASEPAGTK